MTPRKNKPAGFESSLRELEAIVRQLEEEETPLEKSLELFSRGQELSRQCEKQLRAAENQVRVLLEGKDGELSEEPFDEGEPEASDGASDLDDDNLTL